MNRLIALLFCAVASVSHAQQQVIPLPWDKLPVGSRFVYELSSGKYETRRVSKNDGENFEIEVFSIISPGKLRHTIRFNYDGIATEVIYPGGRNALYSPHTCFRVMGRCEYEFTNPIGKTFGRIVDFEMDGDKLVWQHKNEFGAILFEQTATFSDDGLISTYLIEWESKREKKSRALILRSVLPPE